MLKVVWVIDARDVCEEGSLANKMDHVGSGRFDQSGRFRHHRDSGDAGRQALPSGTGDGGYVSDPFS
jgi:hypothetical protein